MIFEVIPLKRVEDCSNPVEIKRNVKMHREMMQYLMSLIASYIQHQGEMHDWTKIAYIDDYIKDIEQRKEEPIFSKRDWYKIHTSKEKHHLNVNPAKDITLLDVIEFICDCILTAKATGQQVQQYQMMLSNEVLRTAFMNTVRWIDNMTELVDEPFID